MPQALADKVRAIAQEGLPVSIFAKFWDNLQLNPSANSVRELYDFLAYKELPITEDGCFLAYKGLTRNGWSISANKETKVLKGKVDDKGRIFNGLNEEIEVRRWDVDDNRQHGCSYGLHVGSLDYAQGFAQGQVVVVKINPKDVVSVPEDCACQKCRVCAYKVIDVFRKRLNVQYAMKMVRKLSMKIKSNTMNSKPELIIIFVESMDSKISFLFVRFKILFLQSIHQRFVCLMH